MFFLLFLQLLLSPSAEAMPCFTGVNAQGDPIISLGLLYSGQGTTWAGKSGELQDGYQFAINKINSSGGVSCGGTSYNLEITNRVDDQSNKAIVKQKMTDLIGTGVDFVLAPYSSGLTGGATEATKAAGKVIIYPGASADTLFNKPAIDGTTYDPVSNDFYGRHNFGLFTPASQYQSAIIDKLASLDLNTKVCIMTRDSSFPISVAQGALDYAKQSGLPVSGDQMYIHTDLDDVTIANHIKSCRDDGAQVLLACTNKIWDAEGYITGLKASGWYPKATSITVYGSQHSFVDMDNHGDFVINLVGPTQWSADLSVSEPNNGWGSPRAVADEWMAQGYGQGTGIPSGTASRDPPTYQGAGAAAAILTLKLAIEKADQANQPSGRITNNMVRDALYQLDENSFWGRLKFAPSGQLVGDAGTGTVKSMYATQVQLNNKGEIPVVLPYAHASIKVPSVTSPDGTRTIPEKFEFKYPAVTFDAYNQGLIAAGHTDTISDLEKDKLECEADKGNQAFTITSVVLNVLLLCGVAGYFFSQPKAVVMVGGKDDNLQMLPPTGL